MNYRKMGRTGLKISSVSIGGWLTLGGSVGSEDSARILRRAVDGGVNFIDLADVYSAGAAEQVAGAAIQGIDRSSLVLSSKVFGRMGDGPNERGLSRKHIIESCEASRRPHRLSPLLTIQDRPKKALAAAGRSRTGPAATGPAATWACSSGCSAASGPMASAASAL